MAAQGPRSPRSQKYEEAEAAFREALRIEPNNDDAEVGLGLIEDAKLEDELKSAKNDTASLSPPAPEQPIIITTTEGSFFGWRAIKALADLDPLRPFVPGTWVIYAIEISGNSANAKVTPLRSDHPTRRACLDMRKKLELMRVEARKRTSHVLFTNCALIQQEIGRIRSND